MTAALRLATVFVAIASVGVSGQSPRWEDLYREARGHVQRLEWKLAEDKLLRAIKSGPPSGRDVIRSGVFGGRDDYFPEYFLGVVYLNTARPAEALVQFQIARKRGLNPKESGFTQIDSLEARANAAAEEAKRNAAQDLRQQFGSALEQAQRLLKEGRFDEAEPLARQARSLGVNNQLADGVLQNIARGRAAARLQERLAKSPPLAELRALLNEYADAGVPLDDLRSRIAAAEADDVRVRAERDSMLEFFSGNYQRAAALLTEAERTTPLSARGFFYRACSIAALATRGRSPNQAQLREARRDYALAAQRPEAFSKDEAYISPKILRLLRGE